MLFVILFSIVAALIGRLVLTKRNYWKSRNVIQDANPMWKFIFGNKSMPEYIKNIYDKYDEPVGVIMGSQPALVLNDLEDIQAVLANDFQSFYRRGIIMNPNDTLADNVLFMEDYQRWKCIRQKITPVFTTSKLKNMFYILDQCGKDFVDLLNESKSANENSFELIYKYTTASIAAAVFGIDTNIKSTMNSPFSEMARKVLSPSLKNNMTLAFAGLCTRLFLLFNMQVFGEHEQFFVDAVKKVMEQRRKENVKRHDFIDICVELQDQGVLRDPTTGYQLEPTYGLLAAQAFFFFIAGADSTAMTMHFTLLELAGNPRVLKKLHQEIDEVFKDGTDHLSYDDAEKLKYLDMVLSESMRKHPNIGSLQRQCTKNTIIPASKIMIKKDELVIIPVFGIHRDAKYFPNPDEFYPERFAPEEHDNIQKYSFLPFGEGNRICIGFRFARFQLKTGLAWLLRKYTLAEKVYAPKTYEKSAFSLRDTKSGYTFIPRNK